MSPSNNRTNVPKGMLINISECHRILDHHNRKKTAFTYQQPFLGIEDRCHCPLDELSFQPTPNNNLVFIECLADPSLDIDGRGLRVFYVCISYLGLFWT